MDYNSTKIYVDLVNNLSSYPVPDDMESKFNSFTYTVFRADQQEVYSKPTSGIGIYIAGASLFCVSAMVADLLHGLLNRKLWFPCNYFTINAFFLSVISVAMKLPMDMSNSMPGDVDQMTKLGSMAFLCTMMANLLPSLATMNSKELSTNIKGLGVMVITLLLNVCVQIVTGVVTYREDARAAETYLPNGIELKELGIYNKDRNTNIAILYMALLLVLLIIHICSSLAILNFKKIIDVKYQECHDTASKEQHQLERLPVEKLTQHVTKYWIMAGTGSLQFISVCSVTTSTAGVICVLSMIIHVKTSISTIGAVKKGDYNSDYKWSVVYIFAIQSIGVILGTIAPLCRCFAPLCFKVSTKSIRNHIKVFKVEHYWIQKLYDWRKRSIPFPSHVHNFKVIIEILKIIFLNFCIQFQEAVVAACKIISLVPFFFMICAFYCLKCLKDTGMNVVSSKRNKESPGQMDEDLKDFRPYVLQLQDTRRIPNPVKGGVLQLQDEMEISATMLKWLSRSAKLSIKKGEKRQPKDLLELIKQSRNFEEVENFDNDYITSLLSKNYQDCWSLSVVTLTTIAVSLPGIEKSKVDELLRSVKEGLVYVTHVEESLNTCNDYVSIQKAAKTLWLEFEVHRQWLGKNLQELASQKRTEEIIELFKNLGKDMVNEVESSDIGSQDDNCHSICANSMYRITKTIKPSNFTNNDNLSDEELLFKELSKRISGILAACLINLPQVIVVKCHNSAIEKREASVQAAAKLLGETTEIINTLQKRDLPRLDPSDLPFIDKWCSAFP